MADAMHLKPNWSILPLLKISFTPNNGGWALVPFSYASDSGAANGGGGGKAREKRPSGERGSVRRGFPPRFLKVRV